MTLEALAFGAVGLLAGLVVNVLADRLPRDLGVSGLWVCPACQHSLPARYGIGLWRELSRTSQCPACQARLPHRHAAVEAALAAMFAFLWWRYGPTPDLALNSFYLVLVALIFVVDLEHRLVLNVVIFPAAVLAIILAVVRPGLVSGLIGGAVGFGFLLPFYIVYPKGLGEGDVKLAAFIGLMLGWPLVLQGLFLGFALGAVVSLILSVVLIVTRHATIKDCLKTYIPYAPFLVVGAYAVLLLPPG